MTEKKKKNRYISLGPEPEAVEIGRKTSNFSTPHIPVGTAQVGEKIILGTHGICRQTTDAVRTRANIMQLSSRESCAVAVNTACIA